MEGSVMCRLRATVCGGVGVTTGRDIQPSLRPQREVHAVSDKHKPVGGNPGMDLWCPRCVKKMTPTCVSLSLPAISRGPYFTSRACGTHRACSNTTYFTRRAAESRVNREDGCRTGGVKEQLEGRATGASFINVLEPAFVRATRAQLHVRFGERVQ